MKILKAPSTIWGYKQTCVGCEAQLEVEKGDVKYQFHSGMGRENDYESWTAQCPICEREIMVPVSKIPKAIQIEIKKGKLPSPGITYADPAYGGPFDR
jgi:hypothetical protein